MIGISKLYCGTVEPSDALRYGRHSGKLPSHLLQFSRDKKPVVVWNCTQRCNLRCAHCYSESPECRPGEEMTTDQGRALIDDLADFGSPVILFSGGEPLMRKDVLELASHAVKRGMRAVLSTNGTLIDGDTAKTLRDIGLSYVGVSLDGLRETHDTFRGREGSFAAALEGIANCQEAGIKVGLRFTISKRNIADVPGIFDLLEERNIPRVCFYHLAYTGKATDLIAEDLTHGESRAALDLIMARTRETHNKGMPREVLTVDNHCDGIYIYLKLLKEDPDRAQRVYELLRMNGGNSSGVGIGCVSWDGSVHPDQFWRHRVLGNVTTRPFSEIWTDPENPLLVKLREKSKHVKGRCAECQWLDCCAGNLRVRAEAVTSDPWAAEPACYLTDAEIGIAPDGPVAPKL